MKKSELEQYAKMFKALSNPHRLKIFLDLSGCPKDERCFKADPEGMNNCQQEFVEELGLAPSTVSHHFKELREAGLLCMKREGKKVIVWANQEMLESVRNLFGIGK